MENNRQIKVERDTYEKNGKTYFSYFIRGQVRGKEVRAAVVPISVFGKVTSTPLVFTAVPLMYNVELGLTKIGTDSVSEVIVWVL